MSGLKKQKNVNYDISAVRLILMLQTLANKDVGQPDVLRFTLLILPYNIIQVIYEHGNVRFQRLCKHILDKKIWLFSMGSCNYGKLCEGSSIPFASKVNVNSIAQVSVGLYYAMFITNDGDLYCVGKFGIYGHDDKEPILISKNVKRVSCGHHHAMFIKDDNNLYGVGNGKYGRLGDGISTDHRVYPPILIFNDVKQVSCSRDYTMFVTNSDYLCGMGNEKCGKLGNGPDPDGPDFDGLFYPRYVKLPIIIHDKVKHVSCGLYHTMFITNNDDLYGMGDGSYAKFGDGIIGSHTLLLPQLIHSNIKQVSCGDYHTLFITNDGDLCYMGFICGNLQTKTTQVLNLKNVKYISSGTCHAMFITDDGNIYGIGNGDYGKLGNGDPFEHCIAEPTIISGFKNVKQVSCGEKITMFIGSCQK